MATQACPRRAGDGMDNMPTSAVITCKLDSTNSPGSNTTATGRSPITEASQQFPEEVKCLAARHDEGNVLQDLTAVPHGNPAGKATVGLGLAYGKPKEDAIKSLSAEGKYF